MFNGLENQEYGCRDPLRWPRDTLYPQKLVLTSPTSGDHPVGIVRSRTKATEFVLLLCLPPFFCGPLGYGEKVNVLLCSSD
jgi:hypothetical protein